MTDDYVQAPADGAGKKLQTFSNPVGVEPSVHAEAVVPVDSTGTELALATEATLATVHGHVDSIDGKITACNTGAVVLSSGTVTTLTNPVSTKTALTASAPTQAAVGVASAVVVAGCGTRKGLILINTSSAYISLGFNCDAVLYNGVTLNPNGGTYVMDEYDFTTVLVKAIASAAASNLAIQEYTT